MLENVYKNAFLSLLVLLLARQSERCHMEKRKTINGEDILFAMSTLGFDNYVEPLKLYLQKYREAAKTDKNLHSTDVIFDMPDDSYSKFQIVINE
ncbi:ccaat-binding transcription factor-related [Holotrichia oblita]|uniref:Ccaat-binding transcription factor-related n=1 Tax=Holotrichia oblita TaxID=644536 RepID=A0ACB9T5E1_HOLOL|nr:ccaat-binding transcription factor-related [Holotrichia oblita]